jgi:hypothetical protein
MAKTKNNNLLGNTYCKFNVFESFLIQAMFANILTDCFRRITYISLTKLKPVLLVTRYVNTK